MMNFESDLVPTTIVPAGTPDLLDEWHVTHVSDDDWGDWLEKTYDPDGYTE